MRYADFKVGQIIEAGSCLIEAQEIINFAQQWDPQPFHVDSASAARSTWQGLIASGWHTCAVAMRLAVQSVLHDSTSCGSPGLELLRWPHPVRPGDQLRLTIEVLELRHSRSRDYGVCRWRWTLRNQVDQTVLDTVLTSLFGLAEQSAHGKVTS